MCFGKRNRNEFREWTGKRITKTIIEIENMILGKNQNYLAPTDYVTISMFAEIH